MLAKSPTPFPFDADERRMIVRLREYLRWTEDTANVVGERSRTYLQAIQADRLTEDFRDDPNAR